ncbi:MAG: polysaccharide biosynthesis C-terminal domain-containing protein [Cyclobacteriaceae bacterium]|nr:polysaccharide biosynthesis C-terminal domain-containing protein [Cyclobacteriaceae bacterium SS2]
MGVVIRQSFWSTLIVYTGVMIGFLNTLIILPRFLEVEEIGLIRLIQANAMMIVPMALLGMNGAYIKYHSSLKLEPKLNNQIITFQLLVILGGAFLAILLAYLNQDFIKALFEEKSSAYNKYLFITIIIFISQSFFDYFITYLWTQLNITFQNYLQEIQLRVVSLLIVLLYGFDLISLQWMIYLLASNYLVALVILLFYVFRNYQITLDFRLGQLKREWINKIIKFSAYSLTLTVGSSIFLNVSYSMTSTYLGLEENGILTVCIFIVTIIELPKRVIIQILAPILSENFAKNDREQIKKNYTSSSINLGLIGFLLMIGIITNLPDLFAIIPKGEVFQKGTSLIMVVSIARIAGMLLGVTPELLTYSKYYKSNIYIMIVGAVAMILLNIWLIPTYGIIGAGISILIAGLISQLSRFIVVLVKLKLSPFTQKHLILFLISTSVFLIISQTPFNLHPIANIMVRSIITVIIFGSLAYFLKVSSEVNAIIHKVIIQITKFF